MNHTYQGVLRLFKISKWKYYAIIQKLFHLGIKLKHVKYLGRLESANKKFIYPGHKKLQIGEFVKHIKYQESRDTLCIIIRSNQADLNSKSLTVYRWEITVSRVFTSWSLFLWHNRWELQGTETMKIFVTHWVTAWRLNVGSSTWRCSGSSTKRFWIASSNVTEVRAPSSRMWVFQFRPHPN